jgi:bacterioferritin-associated ferredoxin
MEIIRQVEIERLIEAYAETGSIAGVGRVMGISVKAPCVRKLIKQRLAAASPSLMKEHSARGSYSIEQIRAAVAKSICMSEVLREIGLSTHGSCANVIKRIMKEHNILSDHFDPALALRKGNARRWSPDEVFIEHSPIPRATLHTHVKRHNVIGTPVCSECGVATTYNRKPISLTVDHINGVSDDNRIENLRWLCPNCHSQTSTYCGKNK